MTSRNSGMSTKAPDLYLPSSPQTLLAALASALAKNHPAQIIYLDDDSPLPDYVRDGIRRSFPQIALSVQSDLAAISEFATLPKRFPNLLRRNLALGRFGLLRPADKPPSWIGSQYRTAYVYLTGKFTAKTLGRRSESVVLREEGLGNYHSLPFGLGKAVLRLATGRSAKRQIMGEERWIDRIEVSQPKALPLALQAKARRLSFADLMAALPWNTRRDLAELFWEGPAMRPVAKTALILSQPIETAGFCSAMEKHAVYQHIADTLERSGFSVILKRHPRERNDTQVVPVIPPFFPIEAWPWLTKYRFRLAVSLCSSAVDQDNLFSEHQLQLVDPETFGRKELGNWRERLDIWCMSYREDNDP